MTQDFQDRLNQLFLDADDLLSDVTNLVKDASIEVLDYSLAAMLDVQAYTEAKKRLKELERLYLKLNITKDEYQEYYKSHIQDSN